MAVGIDAKGTVLTGSSLVLTIGSYTGLTVGGSATALVVPLTLIPAPSANPTVTWDNGGTNQAMTLIGVVTDTTNINGKTYLYGLVNPTTGNKTLAATWTTTSARFIVNAISFTGTATTFATAFTNFASTDNTSSTTTVTQALTLSNPTTDAALGVLTNADTAVGSRSDTLWYSTATASVGLTDAQTVVAAGTSPHTFSWTQNLTQFAMTAVVEINPPPGGPGVGTSGGSVGNFDVIYPWTLIYQQIAQPVNFGTVAPAIQYLPWSEPVRVKPGLGAQLQQFLAQSESAQFPESVTEDRWHQPWSEPLVKAKQPVVWQQSHAFDPLPFIKIDWFEGFTDPSVKAKQAVAWQQFIAQSESAQFPESVTEDRWHNPWSEPVRVKPALPVTEQAFVAQDFPEPVIVSGWDVSLSEPVRVRAIQTVQIPFSPFFDPVPFVKIDWFDWLSEPVRIKQCVTWQQFIAQSESAQFPESVTEDRWHRPWTDLNPYRAKGDIDPFPWTFVPVVTTPISGAWYVQGAYTGRRVIVEGT